MKSQYYVGFDDWEHFESLINKNESCNGFLEIRYKLDHSKTLPMNISPSAFQKRFVKWAYFSYIVKNGFVANIVPYGKNPIYFKNLVFDDKDIFVTTIKVMTCEDIGYVRLLFTNPAFADETASWHIRFREAWKNCIRKAKTILRHVHYRYIRGRIHKKPFWEQ